MRTQARGAETTPTGAWAWSCSQFRPAPSLRRFSTAPHIIPNFRKAHNGTARSFNLNVIKDHVDSDKDPNNNIPLSLRELDLIGHVWRSPESVQKGDGNAWILSCSASDGNIYRLVVSIEDNGGLSFNTFYKQKKKK